MSIAKLILAKFSGELYSFCHRNIANKQMKMKTNTIEEIRRSNLLLLIKEIEDRTGKEGGQAQIARLSKTTPSYLSQIITQFVKPSGRKCIIGSKLARKLERGSNKPEGWMDALHINDNSVESELMSIYSSLSEKAKTDLLDKAREMAKTRKRKVIL